MNGREALRAALMQDADQIDDRFGPEHGRIDRGIVGDVAFHQHDLADIAHRLQERRRYRVTHRPAHRPALRRQPATAWRPTNPDAPNTVTRRPDVIMTPTLRPAPVAWGLALAGYRDRAAGSSA